MKDSSVSPNVQRIGSFTESKFGIASSEDLVYIFDILRNKLYSDKPLAVVREYTTNAADANTEAGLPDEPIVITAPSTMSPAFKVRDFGAGLSEDDVRNIYCMYGRSTKRNSNAFTGQLGLGSKSGFSYGDSFTVTSYHNGKKSVYSAYIDESKLGAVAKIYEEDSNERSGVEISIPVNAKDVQVFKMKIESIIKYFRVKPIVKGNVENKPIERLFEGSNWLIQRQSDSYGSKQAVAVMGNIGYPIDASQVYPSEYVNYWTTKSDGLKMLLGTTVIYFDIGDLSIAASREELEYNQPTIEAIKKAASKAWKEFYTNLSNELNRCEDGFQARGFLWKLSKASSNSWGNIASHLKWNGKSIGTYLLDGKSAGLTIDSYAYNNGHYSTAKCSSITPDEQTVKDFLMFLCDEPSGHSLRMKHVAKQNPGKLCFLFKVRSFKDENGDEVNGMDWFAKNDFPFDKLKKLSEIIVPKDSIPAATRQSATPKGSMKVHQMNAKVSSWGTQSDNWTEYVVDKKDIKYYIEIDRFKIKPFEDEGSFTERTADNLVGLINAVNKHIGPVPTYYAVKTSDINRLNEDSVNLFSYLKELITANKKFNDAMISSMNKQKISSELAHNNSYLLYLDLYKNRSEFRQDKPFAKVLELVSTYHRKEAVPGDLMDAVRMFYKIEAFSNVEDIVKLVKEMNERYKLLSYIGHVYSNQYRQLSEAITDYVNVIDSQ